MSASSDRQIAERIAPVLEAVAERIHYAEARRANYSVMAGALFAAGVTILTLAFGAIDVLILRLAAAFAAAGMISTGLLIIWLFGQQTNRYPFTGATKAWKWFYRDALPTASAFKMSWPRYFRWGKDKLRVEGEYNTQLPIFQSNMRRLSSETLDLDQDLEQLYVLHITEAYKNLFLKHLRQTFNWGIVSTISLGVAGLACGAYFEHSHRNVRTFTVTGSGVEQIFEARFVTSATADAPVMLVRSSVSNQSKRQIHIGEIRLTDRLGWPVPIEATYLRERLMIVDPKSKQETAVSIKLPQEFEADIGGMSFDIR